MIWFVVIVAVNVAAVSVFGEVEVVCSTIKFSWIFVVIISLIGMCLLNPRDSKLTHAVVSAGGAPDQEATGFRYWNSMPFTNGFKGFLAVMPTCTKAFHTKMTSG